MNASTAIKKFGLEQAFNYLYKDPKENLVKLMDWADKFAGGEFETQRKLIREAITDPKHPYYPFIQRLMTDIDPEVMKTIAVNFFINASLVGWPKQEECRKKYGCNIPWAILLDPTSACNLHCTGCWAAEYGHALNLAYDEIDSIIRQGKEQNYQPELFVEAVKGVDLAAYEKDLTASMEKVSAEYPGVALNKVGDGVWQVEIPAKYRVGHEAHFGQVTEHFLDYLKDGKLPDWEVPNMLAKYYTTTSALDMAKAKTK